MHSITTCNCYQEISTTDRPLSIQFISIHNFNFKIISPISYKLPIIQSKFLHITKTNSSNPPLPDHCLLVHNILVHIAQSSGVISSLRGGILRHMSRLVQDSTQRANARYGRDTVFFCPCNISHLTDTQLKSARKIYIRNFANILKIAAFIIKFAF